jgi:ferrous-iron efflux pump FieF
MGQSCQHNHFDFSSIQNESLKKWVTRASVAVAFLLILSKVVAWQLTGSVSLLSSLADSFLDFFASLLSLFAVRQAMKPADDKHRFGFGKVEALAALAQSVFIFLSVLYVLYEAILHLMNPHPISKPMVGLVVMSFSIAMTIALVAFQSHVIRKTQSLAVTADSMHYKADLYLNIGVLCSILFSSTFQIYWTDGAIGLLVAIYIFYTSLSIAKDSLYILMDRELSDNQKKEIIATIKKHPMVRGLHELKTRSSGTKDFVQVHVEMDGDISLKQAHQVATEIEKSLLKIFPRLHVTIHQDPCGVEETHVQL